MAKARKKLGGCAVTRIFMIFVIIVVLMLLGYQAW